MFQPTHATTRGTSIPYGAYTLRSFSLAISRIPSPRFPAFTEDLYPLAVPTAGFPSPLTPSEKGMIMDFHRLRVDLEVLLQCRVRCTKPALPPTPYPLLPWAYRSSSVPFSRTPSLEPKLEL